MNDWNWAHAKDCPTKWKPWPGYCDCGELQFTQSINPNAKVKPGGYQALLRFENQLPVKHGGETNGRFYDRNGDFFREGVDPYNHIGRFV